MTSEQNVKRLYPKAHAVFSIRAITIFADESAQVLGERIGYNGKEVQAWSDAWTKIKERRKANIIKNRAAQKAFNV